MEQTNFATWVQNFITTLGDCPDPNFSRYVDIMIQSYIADSDDDWHYYTLADAYKPRPPVVYAVSGLFELPSLSIVYGVPGCLKSFLLADMAVCVAAGLAWLAPLSCETVTARQTTQCPVVWCDFDNGQRRTLERFGALGRARNLPSDTPLYIYSMPSPWLDAGSSIAMRLLEDRILDKQARLVVIDNLGAVTGKADENSADMVQVLLNFRRLSEQTGAAVVIVHHQRKGNGFKSRDGDSLRGHSSIEAALDLALLVEREPGSDSLAIKSTKTRGLPVYPFGARFTFQHDRNGDLEQARFWGEAVEDTESDSAIEQAIIDAVTQNHPLSQQELVRTIRTDLPETGMHRIRKVANRLAQSGKLRATSGQRGARLYDLP